MAWIGHEYAVHVRRLSAKRGSVVGNANDGYTHMPWPLALAGTQALWASYDAGNFIYTHVHTASPTLRDRKVFDLSFMPGPADGSWLGGMAGDGSTLVFGSILQRCDVEWDCRRLDVEGGVKRVTASATRATGPGSPRPSCYATSGGRIALVPAKTPRFFPDIGPPAGSRVCAGSGLRPRRAAPLELHPGRHPSGDRPRLAEARPAVRVRRRPQADRVR